MKKQIFQFMGLLDTKGAMGWVGFTENFLDT
jgi:hypothetical protein